MTASLANTALPVVETFHSLQGEGVHLGRSAFFIRLGGCTVGCSWCDTKHSWPLAHHASRSPAALAAEAQSAAAAGAAFVVITGGEPLHHDLEPLCTELNKLRSSDGRALPLHLETSGVDPLSGRFDWITLSPKPHRPPRAQALQRCNELKVIVNEASDLAFAESMASAAAEGRGNQDAAVLLLQPAWQNASGLQLALEYVRTHPSWRLSLQTHKWLQIR
ncbi:MAG: 7-carboxy-7-deazaguanine synthase QueE [Prochlorococcaceae cyanobacterium]|jgi:7-carboxy-7-deazaguanine synthase